MAALNKRWGGGATTTNVYTLATNWAPISLRNSTYRWLASGSGTNEYYLDLAGGGDPGISTPGKIYINSAEATEGTAGSLTAGQWDYADNDTLGYSTIYVRLSGGGDPDAQALDHIQMYQAPVATDHVRIPAGSQAITGVDQTSVAIGDFIVEEGFTGTIGSATLPLAIDPNLFEFSGTGVAYIHSIGAVAHDVRNANVGNNGTAGLYLTGTGISTLTVSKGTVGLAWLHGQSATATTVRVSGQAAILYLGKNASVTTAYMSAGQVYQQCSTTTTNAYGGRLFTEEAGTIGTLNVDGNSEAVLNSTGTITTLNMESASCTVDFLKSAEARTVTTLNHKKGRLRIDSTYITTTTYNRGESKPLEVAISPAA